MVKKLKSSILLSIFRRKGGEGLYTEVITDKNKFKYALILSSLKDDEEGLIIYFKNELNWFLLSNQRIVITQQVITTVISNDDIVEVSLDLAGQAEDRIINKAEFTRLIVSDIRNRKHKIQLEKGDPYWGIFQVLSFISQKR